MDNKIDAVLAEALNNLSTGDLYDLGRGLILSEKLDRDSLMEAVFALLDERAKQSRESAALTPALVQE